MPSTADLKKMLQANYLGLTLDKMMMYHPLAHHDCGFHLYKLTLL
jgi:hypothetical protein